MVFTHGTFGCPSGHPVQLAHSYELDPRADKSLLASTIDEFVNRVIRHDGFRILCVSFTQLRMNDVAESGDSQVPQRYFNHILFYEPTYSILCTFWRNPLGTYISYCRAHYGLLCTVATKHAPRSTDVVESDRAVR